jgi:predicted Zn finger-like uncharacterized protein
MTVHCPHCSTAYLLPDHLLGPRGARVRCPKCAGAFVVLAEGSAAPVTDDSERVPTVEVPASAAHGVPAESESSEASRVAAEVLDELATRLGDRLHFARASNKVLSEFGPAMMDAYQEYRRRLGPRASAAVFRDMLRERWEVDLGPGQGSG